MYIDVWARDQTGSILALELKYKTRRLETTVAGEPFALKGQSAQDCNRYDVVKDVCRLERVAALHPNVHAHVVFLTNDISY